MKTTASSIQNMNELIFENKNKAYGAYVIRNAYESTLAKALSIAIGFSAIVVLIAFLFFEAPLVMPKIDTQVEIPFTSIIMDVTPIEKPEIIEKIEPQKIDKPDVTPKSDNLNLVASDDKKDVLTTDNANAVITKNGTPDGSDSVAVEADIKHIVVSKVEKKCELIVDVMPEFNGNLFQYISSKIQYPYPAKESGTSGTVVLQFIVEEDGAIGDVKVLKGVADGCTEEAIRVVKAMPKWKPGKNKGEPVRVLFNLPVRFTIK